MTLNGATRELAHLMVIFNIMAPQMRNSVEAVCTAKPCMLESLQFGCTGWGKITSLNFKVNNKLFEIQKFYFWILKLQHGKF
jgi:hypothetical protein